MAQPEVSTVSEDDICEELLYAAADGELELVRKLVEEKKERVDWQDGNGKTPLHMCAANGHLSVVKYLISSGARHVPNLSGNAPIHWAVLNKRLDVTKALLAAFPDIDVMTAPNKHTSSVMTLAFNGNEAPLIQVVLEHKSAAQLDRDADEAERKMKARQEKEAKSKAAAASTPSPAIAASAATPVSKSTAVGESKTAADDDEDTVTHEFSFVNYRAAPILKVREIPINNDPFGNTPSEDSTGHGIWPAAIICARWIADMKEMFKGKTVLELGAGCGLPGLTALVCTEASKVVFTDIHQAALDNIQHNINLNVPAHLRSRAEIRTIDWYDSKTFGSEKFDVVIGTDLVYQKEIIQPLVNVMKALVKPDGVVQYVVRANSDRDGLAEFIEVSSKPAKGFPHYNRTIAPEQWKDNPLTSGAQELLDLYFYELEASDVEYALHSYSYRPIPSLTITSHAAAGGRLPGENTSTPSSSSSATSSPAAGAPTASVAAGKKKKKSKNTKAK